MPHGDSVLIEGFMCILWSVPEDLQYSQGTHSYILKIKLEVKIWIVSWKSSSSILKPGGIWDLEAVLDRMICIDITVTVGKLM